jgi:DNA-directed RNA polymerase subunit RPC12/RpoP
MGPKAAPTCPFCDSQTLSRSRVRERVPFRIWMRVLGRRPYRCLECWTRFWSSARTPGQFAAAVASDASQLSAATRRISDQST